MERITVSYMRISQDRLGTELGVDRQQNLCRAAADQRGLTLAREFIDNDISASGGKLRPAFELLIAGIENRTIGTIIAVNLDRLLRTNRDKYRLLEACQAHEVSIGLARGTDVDMRSAVGRMIADSLASAARFEVELKSERQRDQRQQAAEAGWAPPSRRAFGYHDREALPEDRGRGGYTNRLHEDEAPLVADAYRQLLAGRSVGSIARWLNAQGATTVKGGAWTHSNVRQMLSNPRYKAIRAVRRLLPGREGMDGKREYLATEIGPAAWPAIVSADTWEAASAILRDPARRVNHPIGETGARYLLPFIGRCGTCGSHLVTGSRHTVLRSTGERVHDRLLRCSTLKHVSRKAQPIEEYVEEVLLGALEDPAARAELHRRAAGPKSDLGAVREQILTQRAMKDAATVEWTKGEFDLPTLRIAHQQFDARLAELDRDLIAAIGTSPTLEIAGSDKPDELWASWPIEVKRSLIKSLLHVVVHSGSSGRPGGRRFDRGSVTVTWRDPSDQAADS